MKFNESRLLRCRLCRQALREILAITVNRMTDEEWQAFAGRQIALFNQSAYLGIDEALHRKSNVVLPVGFLIHERTPLTALSPMIEAMITIAAGEYTAKFSIPLSMLRDTARSMLSRDAAPAPINPLKRALYFMVFVRLTIHLLVRRACHHIDSLGTAMASDPEVVFCVMA